MEQCNSYTFNLIKKIIASINRIQSIVTRSGIISTLIETTCSNNEFYNFWIRVCKWYEKVRRNDWSVLLANERLEIRSARA